MVLSFRLAADQLCYCDVHTALQGCLTDSLTPVDILRQSQELYRLQVGLIIILRVVQLALVHYLRNVHAQRLFGQPC